MSSVVRQDILAAFQASLVAITLVVLLLLITHKQIINQGTNHNPQAHQPPSNINRLLTMVIVPLTIVFLLNLALRLLEIMG